MLVVAIDPTISQFRTAIVPVTLSAADYRRAHDACHVAAQVWNLCVGWVRAQWTLGPGHDPGKYDIQKFVSTISPADRPIHTHSAQAVAHDLAEAIQTYRSNRKAGMKVRAPWRHKNYRPLTFTAGYGWRITPSGKLSLSLGRGRPQILLPIPVLADPTTGRNVPSSLWGTLQLCWDRDARRWSLHISVPTVLPPVLDPGKVCAIDEGIINPLTLAAYAPDSTEQKPVLDVLVINGREARAIKRERNKQVGSLTRAMSRTKPGSKKHARLARAKKKQKARGKARLRDHAHQTTRKAARFIQDHDTGRVVAGDVRGIEQNTRKKRRASRSTRQQISQWDRGTHEKYLAHKTGFPVEHINEAYTSQTCPACLTRNRPSGRNYRCRNTTCGFTCHRDAVGAINILMLSTHNGVFTPIDPNTQIRVTYLRAVPRWSPDQRNTHRQVQQRHHALRARSNAQNQATNPVGVAGGSVHTSAPTPPIAGGQDDHQVTAA